MKFEDSDLPGLFHSADSTAINEQKKYFRAIIWYLSLLILAAIIVYFSEDSSNPFFKILSVILFLSTLFIMIWLHVLKPDDIWYNGRAVAESVKTRSWRWMMKAEPYDECVNFELVRKHFLHDLKEILNQNKSLIEKLGNTVSLKTPISERMIEVRNLSLIDRFYIYKNYRIAVQASWYAKKSKYNKSKATKWFWISVVLHGTAILLLVYNVYAPTIKLPIDVIAVAASSVFTWLQAKKYNELSSSYSLTANEILIIESEKIFFENEEEFSEYILNCENAFSREHTQWYAKKSV